MIYFRPCICIFLFCFTQNLLPGQTDTTEIKIFNLIDTIQLTHHPLNNHFHYLQNKLIISQDSRELAASFDDPSRVLYRHAGISLSNDQNNSYIYRGIPSEYNRWSISEAEIVGPNHLNNAGRISDQSNPSAGGVLAIPFDVIEQFDFYGTPYSSEAISSMSAVSDLSFSDETKSFVKLGLLGFEGSYQSKSKRPLYAHVRYSTVGLLSDLGVDFGDEKIKFYDAFVKNQFSNKWSLLLSLGRSTNVKTAAEDSLGLKTIKDLQEIKFDSEHLISSLQYHYKNTSHTFNYSKSSSQRTSEFKYILSGMDSLGRSSFFNRDEQIISYGGKQKWVGSSSIFSIYWNLGFSDSEILRQAIKLKGRDHYSRMSTKLDRRFSFREWKFRVQSELGLNYMFSDASDFRMEPAIFIGVNHGKASLDLNYSLKHRKDRLTHIGDNYLGQINSNESYSIAYKWYSESIGLKFIARAYEMNLQVPSLLIQNYMYVYEDFESLFTTVSDFDYESKLHSKGLEFILDKTWGSSWYTNINVSFFKARYPDTNQDAEDNYSQVYNFVVSKEFELKDNRQLNINLTYHKRGGSLDYRFDPVDELFSSVQVSGYERMDLRLLWKSGKHMWVLDIQNLTNRINPAYSYYDVFLKEEVQQDQLGLIPILSYKRFL